MKPERICLILFISLLIASCAGRDRFVVFSGYAQGGTWTVKANLRGVKVHSREIAYGIDSILTLVDTTVSGYNKGSILSRFNAGETVTPNSLFSEIFSYCSDIYDETGGRVDVASGPLFDIWGFGFKTDSLPSDSLVMETLATCGMSRLRRDIPSCVPVRAAELVDDGGVPGPVLNFNAVAQGYTCDLVADYLAGLGVTDMMVDIGEIYCRGHNPGGQGWTIGVDRPVDGNERPGEDLDGIWQSDGSPAGIVTSGNYRKFYVLDGRKYAHTIDPSTGYPVQHNLLSATVVASSAAAADAYATYCMVIGLDAARDFIESRDDLEGYLIYDGEGGMEEWASSGFSLVEPSEL